jgi:hypothetical protein
MTTTKQEAAQQAVHERRMQVDREYAYSCKIETLYSSTDELESFIEDHQLMPVISKEFLRALLNAEQANQGLLSASFEPSVSKRNAKIKEARHQVIQAAFAIKQMLDGKIFQMVRDGQEEFLRVITNNQGE